VSRFIGIDLGTTNSVVAVMEGGKPIIIPNIAGGKLTPSIVTAIAGPEEKISKTFVGETAKREAIINPNNTIFSIKRFVGRKFSDPNIQQDIKLAPYKISAAKDGSILVLMGEKWYTPTEIIAIILKKFKHDSEIYLDESVKEAVITVPAYFNTLQRQSIRTAGWEAGFKLLRIINEPSAACLAYGVKKNETIAVYHFGGGTFDISMIEVGEGICELRATNGNTHLGGDDFDQCIINWVCNKFEKEEGIDLRKDKVALQRLKWAAEQAKCDLSSVIQTNIHLPYIIPNNTNPKNLTITLTRKKLEELVTDLIDKTLIPCKQVLRDANISISDIDKVILVGQQTRMPAMQKVVKKFFNKDPFLRINSTEVVASGAAIWGGIVAGSIKDTLLLDIIPNSLSIETQGGIYRLIERNTTIPTRHSMTISPTIDYQNLINIHVLEGDRAKLNDNVSLGKFILSGIHSAPKGVPKIEVTFDIDATGILKVTAKDMDTGHKRDVTFDGYHKLDSYDISELHKAEEKERKQKEEDERRKREDLRISQEQAYEIIHESEAILSKESQYIAAKLKIKMNNKIFALQTALQGDDASVIYLKIKELNKVNKTTKISLKFKLLQKLLKKL